MPSCMRCLSSHLWARTRASARAQSSSLPLPAPTRVFDVPEQSDSYHARTWPIQATLQSWGPSEHRPVHTAGRPANTTLPEPSNGA